MPCLMTKYFQPYADELHGVLQDTELTISTTQMDWLDYMTYQFHQLVISPQTDTLARIHKMSILPTNNCIVKRE